MAEMIRYTPMAGNGLTDKQLARLAAAAKQPIHYTEDCPELTEEQLAQFYPANFATWEEREHAMREAELEKANVKEPEPIAL